MHTHPLNPNLHLTYESDWDIFPVLHQQNGLVVEYLQKIQGVIDTALQRHPRALVIRCDLRFPQYQTIHYDSAVISRFIESLKAQIQHDQHVKASSGKRIHPCELRYVWVKEQVGSEFPHYHVALFLNRDSYFNLGQFQQSTMIPIPDTPVDQSYFRESANNMAGRIMQAWSSALRLHESMTIGLVHFPENSFYALNLGDAAVYSEVFKRLSYFANTDTKQYGDGTRWFGASRR